ncbi:uncharacterized protein N7496_004079 [Penicillium cataractarum]|uniref:Non-structural maintenance of chromosomes element 4 n=1 Tax=Penicillium cataractarum TaxID=2100454 RepID=A0A9W9SNG1_9EURO|nr:uncharacterized protein N7496_004079 [Penicillium cataractarum]KAJ5381651.1 hypothetical protein N7496_004079 [Penicillium cataractarum]
MARIAQSQLDEASAYGSSPPSSPDSSSDKENRRQSVNKRSTARMLSRNQLSKRRRLTDRASNIQSQAFSQRKCKRFYDPDQPEEERRRLRKNYRDLTTDFNDSRTEYMRPGNDGIFKTLETANNLYTQVKQTSDATIDSRLLVNAADLTHKKTAQLALGDASAGIDVDEFVSKCISYMRRGPELADGSTQQRQRPRQTQRDPNDSDDGDSGDAMNWDWLGRMACLHHNSRPAVSGFLLGPLSVQKRSRQNTQRAGREQFNSTQAVQPQELRQEDLGQQANANLTETCKMIQVLLNKTIDNIEHEVNGILTEEGEPTEERVLEVMYEHHTSPTGGVCLFKFCINPQSFGQSVENLFYVSFLIRDGHAGVSMSARGTPTLHSAEPYPPHEAQAKRIQKHQAIFSLDFETWADIIKEFNIDECIIPHREDTEEGTGQTWYGS